MLTKDPNVFGGNSSGGGAMPAAPASGPATITSTSRLAPKPAPSAGVPGGGNSNVPGGEAAAGMAASHSWIDAQNAKAKANPNGSDPSTIQAPAVPKSSPVSVPGGSAGVPKSSPKPSHIYTTGQTKTDFEAAGGQANGPGGEVTKMRPPGF